MVKNHYRELFKDDVKWFERAVQVGQRTFELSQYIVDIFKIEDVGALATMERLHITIPATC